MRTEITVRLGFFFGVFILVAVGEIFAPRRELSTSKSHRWSRNLAMVSPNPLSVRLIFPVLPVAMALLATDRQWGLLNNIILPYWPKIAIGVSGWIFPSTCSM
ncbi:MAG: hypothetical protein AB9866_20115 [Syntrophobacteraceae bacterium]